jgi:hypothetical protein
VRDEIGSFSLGESDSAVQSDSFSTRLTEKDAGAEARNYSDLSIGQAKAVPLLQSSIPLEQSTVCEVARSSPVLQVLVGEDGAVADFVFLDLVDGFVGAGHGEAFGGCLDVVAGGDVEHFADALR